jgi:hypothetical protein
MKHLHESFGETLTRLLGKCPRPSSVRMESGINRVWERLNSEIVDAPSNITSDSFAVRRHWTLRFGFVDGAAAARGSLLTLLATFVRSLWHGGSSMDE